MKILVCFGTRPEAIKLAPVIYELQKQGVNYKVCVTGQHREMLDQVLNFFGLNIHYDLNLMTPGQSLNVLGSRILTAVDKVLDEETPDVVLVHGDTTSSSIVALAAFHKGIAVGHVEAGLRTYNKRSPFPEEMNRQITARIADFHFSPTDKGKANLLKEGIPAEKIFVTGNTIVDALLWSSEKMKNKFLSKEINDLEKIIDPSKKTILVTGHRRENFGFGMEEVCKGISDIAKWKDVQLIFPVHLNPVVKETIHNHLAGKKNIHLIDPLSYPATLWLMRQCDLIISDSGGIQEEAPTFQKPVIVTREVSERMEGVEAGFSFLVGTDRKLLTNIAMKLLETPPDYSNTKNPYGDGQAARRIVENLLKETNLR